MKIILCSAFSLILSANSIAGNPSGFDPLFLKNHITAGFDIPFLITQYGEQRGIGELRLRTLPGFAVKVEYTYNFNKYIGISSGSKMGLQVFGYNVKAESNDFDLPQDLKRKYSQVLPFLNIPLLLTPRVFICERSFLQADLGAGVIFFASGTSVSTLSYKNGPDTEQIFEMNAVLTGSPKLTFHSALSYAHVLKSLNMLKLGLAYNFGGKSIMQGNYAFNKDDVVVGSGNIFSSLNYFAIEFSYVFTRTSLLTH